MVFPSPSPFSPINIALSLENCCSDSERFEVLQGIEAGRWTVLYVSPEGLLAPSFWARLGGLDLVRLVIDEAHCVATWGNSFRPVYRRLGAVRRVLGLPVAAFTATATPATIACIYEVLEMQQPKIVQLSSYRANLHLAVAQVFTAQGRWQQLLKFLGMHPGTCGLVYVRSRATAETLAQRLEQAHLNIGYYHAGLASLARRQLEQKWLSEEIPVLICTSAFGMSINHPRVRWVVHYEAPLTTEDYLQEIGRAGRDGQLATALLLASEPTGWFENTDQKLQQYFTQQATQQQQQAARLAQRLIANNSEFTEQNPQYAQALSLLHQQGNLVWETPFHYRLKPKSSQIWQVEENASLRAMRCYPHSRQCRWQFLLTSLGENRALPCGHCDRCTRS